jgi:CPA1 family monovalent cation:H+ antiporter
MGLTTVVDLALGGVAVIACATLAARRWAVPTAIVLVLAGVTYALLPGPNVHLDPHIILVLVLPPLLYSAALNSSLIAIRASIRPVISLSVLLVLATAFAVGAAVSAVLPGLPFAAAIALGAAVSPPDPVAALSVGRRARLPAQLITLIEGEGLLNDATALTTYQVAVAAAVGGSFSWAHAGLRFGVAAVGGTAVGIAVAWLVHLPRTKFDDPLVENALSLSTPFAAYLAAEAAHTSGVLAVVVAGLWFGHRAPGVVSGATRLQTRAVWRLTDFLLEGFVFLLIGQQLPDVLRSLRAYPVSQIVGAAVLCVGVVLVIRPLWLIVTSHLPGRMLGRGAPLSLREVVALSFAGTRGVISLATIFALPLVTDGGAPFPDRELLIFCTYCVVLVTLVGQGLAFGPLLRRLGVQEDPYAQRRERSEARVAAARAAVRFVDELPEEDRPSPEVMDRLRRVAQERYRRATAHLERAQNEDPEADDPIAETGYLRRLMIEAQRDELLRWRDAGRLPDRSLRALERELDHEEGMLPN